MAVAQGDPFSSLVDRIAGIGYDRHRETLLAHARANAPLAKRSIKELPALPAAKRRAAIVISAGPSVRRQKTIERLRDARFAGTIVAADGSYAACLRAGLIPDFVVTLDPHNTRVVRWFGDPDYERHSAEDDYFERQDLDSAARDNALRRNKSDIELINRHAKNTMAIVSTSAPPTVVARIREAGFQAYWWNPLVDDPNKANSLTRQIYEIKRLPCIATGGTVGTAAWMFAQHFLKPGLLAVAGMDFGYYADTPLSMTQTYYELLEMAGDERSLERYFVRMRFPLTGEEFITDPTYFWYRKNFLSLARRSTMRTLNCTEAGTLFGDNIECASLDAFLRRARG